MSSKKKNRRWMIIIGIIIFSLSFLIPALMGGLRAQTRTYSVTLDLPVTGSETGYLNVGKGNFIRVSAWMETLNVTATDDTLVAPPEVQVRADHGQVLVVFRPTCTTCLKEFDEIKIEYVPTDQNKGVLIARTLDKVGYSDTLGISLDSAYLIPRTEWSMGAAWDFGPWGWVNFQYLVPMSRGRLIKRHTLVQIGYTEPLRADPEHWSAQVDWLWESISPRPQLAVDAGFGFRLGSHQEALHLYPHAALRFAWRPGSRLVVGAMVTAGPYIQYRDIPNNRLSGGFVPLAQAFLGVRL